MAGVDEAGRGAVIGPLVVAGIALEDEMVSKLEEKGVRDSKRLTRRRREEIYSWLSSEGIESRYEIISSERVDSYTRRRGGPGINALEIEAIIKIAEALKPDTLIIDSPTMNVESIVLRVSQHLPNTRIIAQCHADENYPVVAAASIVAKVIRDKAISELSKSLGDIGSGYPSDLKTLKFLHQLIRQGGHMGAVRRSWRTLDRVMPTLNEYLAPEAGSSRS